LRTSAATAVAVSSHKKQYDEKVKITRNEMKLGELENGVIEEILE
jgi:hypothetical protein